VPECSIFDMGACIVPLGDGGVLTGRTDDNLLTTPRQLTKRKDNPAPRNCTFITPAHPFVQTKTSAGAVRPNRDSRAEPCSKLAPDFAQGWKHSRRHGPLPIPVLPSREACTHSPTGRLSKGPRQASATTDELATRTKPQSLFQSRNEPERRV
jgi:hypothetical protein